MLLYIIINASRSIQPVQITIRGKKRWTFLVLLRVPNLRLLDTPPWNQLCAPEVRRTEKNRKRQ